MCGIAGVALRDGREVSPHVLRRMLGAIRHRGPDGQGAWAEPGIGLAHVRLSILDIAGGAQPMSNESGSVHLTYNGEIFNHAELRDELRAAGWRFRTRSDTEVLLRAYEAWGAAMLDRFNGQFAFALHDSAQDGVLIARDRFGILPLFYAEQGGDLVFASEVKGILASGMVSGTPDPRGLDEVFTFWAARPPRTPFAGVKTLEPGTFGWWREGTLRLSRYYDADHQSRAPGDTSLEELDWVLRSSIDLRTRADVTVGAYLSGGLDSSVTCALTAQSISTPPRTFSVAFDDAGFDESPQQTLLAAHLGCDHASRRIGQREIADALPATVWHAETPMLRTAPAPMFLLSRLVRDSGIKVVLSGEGADELFLGYELFKETLLRRSALDTPAADARPGFSHLYPELPARLKTAALWGDFFVGAGPADDLLFSHLPRFGLSSRIRRFYSPEFRAEVGAFDPLDEMRRSLPAAFPEWSALGRAAWLEMQSLLSPYLLATQGDRMAMAHGVELRVPFLDHRLFEFAAALPDVAKLNGRKDKAILRDWAARVLPAAAANRPKHAYRAPVVAPLLGAGAPEWVRELLTPDEVRRAGIFSPAAVAGLVRRCASGAREGELERQALVAIVTTGLWHRAFVNQPVEVPSLEPLTAL
jgi:asparagine synthase (glutamine-hydrolysing)